MSLDPALRSLFSTCVSLAAPSDRDAYGTPTWAAATTYAARVVRKLREVRTVEGDVRHATHEVWVWSTCTTAATPSHRLIWSGSTLPVLAVETFSDEDGTHHTKIMAGVV